MNQNINTHFPKIKIKDNSNTIASSVFSEHFNIDELIDQSGLTQYKSSFIENIKSLNVFMKLKISHLPKLGVNQLTHQKILMKLIANKQNEIKAKIKQSNKMNKSNKLPHNDPSLRPFSAPIFIDDELPIFSNKYEMNNKIRRFSSPTKLNNNNMNDNDSIESNVKLSDVSILDYPVQEARCMSMQMNWEAINKIKQWSNVKNKQYRLHKLRTRISKCVIDSSDINKSNSNSLFIDKRDNSLKVFDRLTAPTNLYNNSTKTQLFVETYENFQFRNITGPNMITDINSKHKLTSEIGKNNTNIKYINQTDNNNHSKQSTFVGEKLTKIHKKTNRIESDISYNNHYDQLNNKIDAIDRHKEELRKLLHSTSKLSTN